MYFNLFPFSDVPQNCRLVIYGFGVVGQQFLQQIDKTKWCKLICFVDRKAEEFDIDFAKIISPEKFYQMETNRYDKVLIGVKNCGLANEIKHILIRNGIDKKKILSIESSFLTYIDSEGERLNICESDIYYNKDRVIKYLEDYFNLRNKSARNSYMYYPALFQLNYKNRGNDKYLEEYKKVLKSMDASEKKVIAIQLLFDAGLYDTDCVKMMVQTLKDYNWKDDTAFGLIFDIQQMLFEENRTDCMYPEIFTDIRDLLWKIKKYYGVEVKKQEYSNKITKVAIICHYFCELERIQACVDLDILYANQISNLGYEVQIFVGTAAYESMEDCDVFLLKKNNVARKKYQYDENLAKRLNENIKVNYFPYVLVKEGLNSFINSLERWNPDIILNIADEIGIEAFLSYGKIPTVFLPFRGYQTSMLSDGYITPAREKCLQENKIYHSIDEETIYETNLSNTVVRENPISYIKTDYFNENDFVVVSVGRRLNYEITDELIECMCQMLNKYDEIRWVLVGDGIYFSNEIAKPLIDKQQIIFWGFEENIEKLYKMCDVYLEPNRAGGAHSVRLAMLEGIPVALTDYPSDISSIMNESDMVHGDYEELVNYLEKLYIDKNFYSTRSQRMKNIMSKLDPKDDGRKIMEICEMVNIKFIKSHLGKRNI
ncbi:MAG: glycosyltransferase family 4 protein [Lachnospiraceae bacterium]|nr:glycosyltransferase family 4 protein [Lachnospiraceae bacterium]